jgi:hypothetical protein
MLHVLPQGTSLLDAGPAAGPASRPGCAEDCAGMWAALQGGSGCAAVLVRPDGHISWVHEAQAAASCSSSAANQQELARAMTEVLQVQQPGDTQQ